MEPLASRFRAIAARGGMAIDREVYRAAGRDPLDPVLLGSGTLDAPLGIFGRDPGRLEAEIGEPFVGKGGQLIRAELHRALGRPGTPDLTASIDAGRGVFWCNTVPYKPVGNKAWSASVKRRFLPIIAEIIAELWTGSDLITCGNEAFFWFGMADRELRPALQAHWARPDRYESSLEVRLHGRPIRLHPLPHPSPLNARWYPRFPGLLRSRLAALGWPEMASPFSGEGARPIPAPEPSSPTPPTR